MATTEKVHAVKDHTTHEDTVKNILLEEVKLGLKLAECGINYNADEVRRFQDPLDQISEYSRRRGLAGFSLPHGIFARSGFNSHTPYELQVEDDQPVLYDENRRIGVISFHQPHPVTETILSTGEKFRDIANVNIHGGISVAYGSECSLKKIDEYCLFCSNNERAKDGALCKVYLRTLHQVAECYDLARQAGVANHFRITSRLASERRELEYYIDVADTIREKYSSFYGVAIIGAPADLSVVPKYKEAGFLNISSNIESWDKNIFAAICPGKEKRNVGLRHWVDALEYYVSVFGKGNVHSNIVGGLEPKQSILEGIEYLASKGVLCHFSAFRPEKGTPLEGYRSPEPSWHWDLLDKVTDIYIRYGFNTLQMYSGPASGPHAGQVFQIKKGEFSNDVLLPYQYPSIDKE
jgi:hypothetical protein